MAYLIDNNELMAEWDWNKNQSLCPDKISYGSHKRAWWICSTCGNEWDAVIKQRVYGTGCPKCGLQRSIELRNMPKQGESFQDVFPDLAIEWNRDKNFPLLPTQVKAHSNKRVWWKCKNGHEWMTGINQRANGTRCPHCVKELRTSFLEQTIYYYIKQYFSDAIWGYRSEELEKFEIDVYIPSIKVGIEYDGERWHKDATRDIKKDAVCDNVGILLYRIREPNCEKYNGTSIHYNLNDLKQSTLEEAIYFILNQLGVLNPTVDIVNHYEYIQMMVTHLIKETSLASEHPELAKEWHPSKNGTLNPNHLRPTSNKKVWWMCDDGHEWASSVSNRVNGRGCPYCSGKRVLQGFNDLLTTHPHLEDEWDYEQNTTFNPTEISAGSNKKAWWKCRQCGHKWSARIEARAVGRGCPICGKAKSSHIKGKAVLCVETGIIYESMLQAEKDLNISHIYRAYDKDNRTAGGYHWRSV